MSQRRIEQLTWAVQYLEHFSHEIDVQDVLLEEQIAANKPNINEVKALKHFNERIKNEVKGQIKVYREILNKEAQS